MADLIITPSTGKIEFIYQGGPDGQQGQTSRVESIIVDTTDGVVFSGRISASSVTAPLNIINVTAGSSNVNYPFIFASSGETGAKSLLMDSAGGTYNPSTNTATIDVSGNSATTTLASNSSQLNGQVASYYTDINARLGYTPVNKAGDTVTGNLIINGNFSVNGSFTAFSASNVYISSSQLYIEDNILTLNAFSPYLRYAGVEMYDSGSGTLSSLLWDGEADYFFLTGSSVNGKIITGPDGQTNLTANYIPKATAGYKLGNSLIYDDGTNVGIGTTSPLQKLHVVGNISTIAQAGSGAEASRLQFYNIGAATYDIASIRAFVGAGQTNRGELGFYVNNGATQQLAMYIDRSQNVGLGTTSPLERITFGSSDSIIARSSATDFNSGYCSRILFNQGGTGYGYLGFYTYQGGTGGGERMRIAENGNVGIGTTSPGALLEISSSTAASLLNVKGAGGNNLLFVSGSGAVGIGTTSPVTKLEVYRLESTNRTTTTDILTINADANNSPYSGHGGTILFRGCTYSGTSNNAQGNRKWGQIGMYLTDAFNNFSGENMFFAVAGDDRSDTLTTAMTIQYNGNIGIGVTTPTQKLEVAGYVMAGESSYRTSIYGNSGGAWIGFGDTSNTVSLGRIGAYGSLFNINSINGDTSFQYNGSEKMRITTGGNVGIGTTNPVSKLEVSGSVTATSFTGSLSGSITSALTASYLTPANSYTVTNLNASNISASLTGSFGMIGIGTTNPSSRVHIYENANRVTYIAQNNNHIARFEAYGTATAIDTTASNGIFFRISGGDIVKFAADGNVGIGTTSPGYKLHVTGDIYANGGWLRVSGTSGLYFETYGGGWFMDDATWVRTYSAKSVWTSTGLLGSNGGLTVGYGGTSPTSLGAIIAGSVGIGTNSPATKLEVYGVVRVSESSSGGILQLTAGASAIDIASTFYGGSRRPITFTMDSEKVRIAADGNVGIGTTSPANKLHVEGGNSVPLYVKGGTSAWVIFERNTKQLYLNANYSDTNLYAQISPRSSDSMSLSLSSREVAGDLLVSTSGNVGIGTTSPNTLLNIHGATPFVRINTTATADHGIKISYGNSDTHGLHLLYNANSAVSYIDNTYPVNAGFVYGDIYFRQNVAGTMTTRMTIKADGGNVGIGTTGPSARLHVFDSNESPATGNLLVTSTGGNASIRIDSQNTSKYTYFTLSQGGVGKFELGITPTSSDLYINHNVQSGANGAAIYIKKADGNVGIGTTSPASRLHVVGSEAYIRVTDSDDSGVFFIGNASGFGYIRAFSRDFRFLNAAGASLINIASGGNIGIGTTAPNDKLDVVGRVYAYRYIAVSSNASLPAYATDTNTGMFNAATNQIGFSISSAEKVRIDTNGNVGIGTTVPGKKLDVEGVVRTRGATGTGGFEIGAATTGTAKWRIEWDSASDSLDFNWVG